MVHKCKVQCHTVSATEMDLLGMKDDGVKWLPFAIDLNVITAIKMSTDEVEEESYNCSSIFTTHGDTFILDTPYHDMVEIWANYVNAMWDDEQPNDDDIIL